MSFYDDWSACIENCEDDSDYVEAYLKKKDYTTRLLYNGSDEEIASFCKLLINYDIDKMIGFINDSFYTELSPSKIVQFSDFEKGTSQLVQVLYVNSEGMNYPSIGRILVRSEDLNAATKYGENHSKLARDFDLVKISEHKPAIVKLSRFGECFAYLEKIEQEELLRKLALRDPLIKNIIAKAAKGPVYYIEECNCLSESTKIRRRSNVKKLIELIFLNSTNSIKNNIIW